MAPSKGIWETQIKRSANNGLPTSIKCKRCGKFKSQQAYSDRQLGMLRFTLSPSKAAGKKELDPSIPQICCTACSDTQVEERECASCGKFKVLDEFSKSQRKCGDEARCIACMDKHLADQAAESAKVTKTLKDDSDSDDDLDEEDGGASLFSGMDGLSVRDTEMEEGYLPRRGARTGLDSKAVSMGGSSAKSSKLLSSIRSGSSTSAPSAFDPSKYGAPSTASPVKVGKSGWAKVKATPAEPEPTGNFSDDDVPLPQSSRAPDEYSDEEDL